MSKDISSKWNESNLISTLVSASSSSSMSGVGAGWAILTIFASCSEDLRANENDLRTLPIEVVGGGP